MDRCAVIIGVNKTGGLPVLSAAVQGAKDFQSWAKSQKFETVLHTDEKKPVTINAITNSILKFYKKKKYKIMIIFFAGHGILKSPGEEKWLLSNSPSNPNEAVNVVPSKFLSKNTGIPHIVFISDACRSIPNNPLISQVAGSVIFPNVKPTNADTDIDMFYATIPGNPAYEAAQKNAVKNYKGIYTNCLLKGLYGKVPQILKEIANSKDKEVAVFAYELKEYLRKAVPISASKVKITLTQNPDAEITSRSEDKYLSKFAGKKQPKYKIKKARIVAHLRKIRLHARPRTITHKKHGKIKYAGSGYIPSPITTGHVLKTYKIKTEDNINNIKNKLISNTSLSKSDVNTSIKYIMDTKGMVSFETLVGFTIIGAQNIRIFSVKAEHDTFTENNSIHIRLPFKPKSKSILIILNNGTSFPLAVLPGFIGTVLIKENKIIDINYIPSRNNQKYRIVNDNEINKRRALIAMAVQHGIFRFSSNKNDIISKASYLRYYKAFDPTLGLYSSYAYAQAGNTKEILSVYKYMSREPEPVLFDVAMLAEINNFKKTSYMKHVAPFCPMLTQGWSYLSAARDKFPKELGILSENLLSGLWTTFNAKITDYIIETKIYIK